MEDASILQTLVPLAALGFIVLVVVLLLFAKRSADETQAAIRARGWSFEPTSTFSFRVRGTQRGVAFELTQTHSHGVARMAGGSGASPLLALDITAQPVAALSLYFGKLAVGGLVLMELPPALVALEPCLPGESVEQAEQRFERVVSALEPRPPAAQPWPEHYVLLVQPGDTGPGLMSPELARLLDAQPALQRAHLIREPARLRVLLTGAGGSLTEIDRLVALAMAVAPACGHTLR